MRLALLDHGPGLSAYIGEILDAWGLACWSAVPAGAVAALDPAEAPVLIVPAGAATGSRPVARPEEVVAFAERGGTVICFLPEGALATAAGIESAAEKPGPLRLRLAGPPLAGLAGESLPVVGPAATWTVRPGTAVLAILHLPGQDAGESDGLVRTGVGRGHILAAAFDLPRAVLLLRQGDPARREERGRPDGPARPTQLACDLGPEEPGWIPYADLLGRVLVDLVRRVWPAPAPLLWHLPAGASGILLYSGDEDGAEVEWNRTEFEAVTAAGGRMNLFVIPGNTHSTRADVAAYRGHHDVGPHPDIRALDHEPVAVRVAELERQVRQFEEMYGVEARCSRNHCVAWAGYLEMVEGLARAGVRLESNYFCSTFLRGREYAPYAAFGAALPLRYGDPGGGLLPVHQQHTHTMDDVYFGPEWVAYSYHLSPPQWEAILARVFDEVVGRFHVPHAVCIHPSNWVRFSRDQGTALLCQASQRGMPIWSFDQWLTFWEARQAWRIESQSWNGERLRAELAGEAALAGLTLALPQSWNDSRLAEVRVNGRVAGPALARRFGQAVSLVEVGDGGRASVEARYAPVSGGGSGC
ncbi:MAG: hypothetical protein ABIL09_06870 [Gemmatimonadota bacterium]